MNYLEILGILFIFYIILNKIFISKNFFLDPSKQLSHKSFLNKSSNIPLSGGILILISCLIFLTSEYNVLKLFLLLICIIGILSDLEILKSPTKRIVCQALIVTIFLIIFINIISVKITIIFLKALILSITILTIYTLSHYIIF